MRKKQTAQSFELDLLKRNINLKKLIDLLDNDSDELLYSSGYTILFNIFKSSTKKELSITECQYAKFYPDLSIEEDDKKKYILMINGTLLTVVSDNFILKENFKKFYPNKNNKEISLIFQNIYSKMNKSYYLIIYEEIREFITHQDGPYPEYYSDYYVLGKFKNTKSLMENIKNFKKERKKKYSKSNFRKI